MAAYDMKTLHRARQHFRKQLVFIPSTSLQESSVESFAMAIQKRRNQGSKDTRFNSTKSSVYC